MLGPDRKTASFPIQDKCCKEVTSACTSASWGKLSSWNHKGGQREDLTVLSGLAPCEPGEPVHT